MTLYHLPADSAPLSRLESGQEVCSLHPEASPLPCKKYKEGGLVSRDWPAGGWWDSHCRPSCGSGQEN